MQGSMPETFNVTPNPVPDCTCGRSPFKHCSGLHSLSEEEAKRQLDIYHENVKRDNETYYSNKDQQT